LTNFVKKEENYKKLTVPACAFITFESDDGLNEALNYSKRTTWWANRNKKEDDGYENVSILKVQPKFIASTEPTNIIWENRHIKGINYGARVFSALFITTLMLMISFTVIILFKQTSIKYNMKFPNVDCEEIINLDKPERNLHRAGLEYIDWIATDGAAPLNGALQCFCDTESKTIGPQKWIIDKKYSAPYDIEDINDTP
jgi:hypothetical protein